MSNRDTWGGWTVSSVWRPSWTPAAGAALLCYSTTMRWCSPPHTWRRWLAAPSPKCPHQFVRSRMLLLLFSLLGRVSFFPPPCVIIEFLLLIFFCCARKLSACLMEPVRDADWEPVPLYVNSAPLAFILIVYQPLQIFFKFNFKPHCTSCWDPNRLFR